MHAGRGASSDLLAIKIKRSTSWYINFHATMPNAVARNKPQVVYTHDHSWVALVWIHVAERISSRLLRFVYQAITS
jgi:hypothetical protein